MKPTTPGDRRTAFGVRPSVRNVEVRTPNAEGRTPYAGGRRAFTIIELLVVIAIMAILAAFIFPAMAGLREGGRRTGCMENMRQIVQALKMYKDDWGVYPESLYGYDQLSNNGSAARRFLYPGYIKDRRAFVCPASVWTPPGEEPDFSAGSPARTGDDLCMSQAVLMNQGGARTNQYYYPWDSYDIGVFPNDRQGITCGTASQPVATPALNAILDYQRKWVPSDPVNPPDPRQLMVRQPSEQTVVTWCLNHFHLDRNNNPESGSLALVAFLDGRVQSLPATSMMIWDNAEGHTWKVQPKP